MNRGGPFFVRTVSSRGFSPGEGTVGRRDIGRISFYKGTRVQLTLSFHMALRSDLALSGCVSLRSGHIRP